MVSDNRFGELRRTANTLKNCNDCYIEDFKERGYSDGDVLEFMAKNLKSLSYSRPRKILCGDGKLRLKRLIENAWINEMYLRNGVFNHLIGRNHFFFIDYIAFYYSIFNSLSCIAILFDRTIPREAHKKKITAFNNLLYTNKFIREIYGKPFSIVLNNTGINLKNFNLKADKSGLTNISKQISNVGNIRNQRNSSGCPRINETLPTLKVAGSVLRYYLKKSDGICSMVNYLMDRRHFFHYNCSILHDETGYRLDKDITSIRTNAYKILQRFNFSTEMALTKISDIDLYDVYSDFEEKLIKSRCDPSELDGFERICDLPDR